MFERGPFSLFSIGRIINNLEKTLGVVNEIIPIYKNAKPIINTTKETINSIKSWSNTNLNKILDNTNENMKEIKEKINTTSVNSINKLPQFFQ